jgi:hypothetical protein
MIEILFIIILIPLVAFLYLYACREGTFEGALASQKADRSSLHGSESMQSQPVAKCQVSRCIKKPGADGIASVRRSRPSGTSAKDTAGGACGTDRTGARKTAAALSQRRTPLKTSQRPTEEKSAPVPKRASAAIGTRARPKGNTLAN